MPASPDRRPGAVAAAIRCRDLAAMTAFYRDVLGLEVVEGDRPDASILLSTDAAFGAPARHVALFPAEDEDDEALLAPHRLTLTVPGREALDRAEAGFRAHGLAPSRAELGWAGWECLTVEDPEGNVVELAAPVSQRTVPAPGRDGQG